MLFSPPRPKPSSGGSSAKRPPVVQNPYEQYEQPKNEIGELIRAAGEQIVGAPASERGGPPHEPHPFPGEQGVPTQEQDRAFAVRRLQQLNAELEQYRSKEKQEEAQEKQEEQQAENAKKEREAKSQQATALPSGRSRKDQDRKGAGIKKKQTQVEMVKAPSQ